MYEAAKLEEAHYFLSAMVKAQYDLASSDVFKYNLSAFLSAARCVPQYALEELRSKVGGQQWYDQIVSGSKVIRFFRDKRDFNIHREPVQVRQAISAQFSDALHFGASLTVVLGDSDGNVIETRSTKADEVNPASYQQPVMNASYKFDDWQGSEDVVSLCRMYTKDLGSLIADGKKLGLLT